jgi:hypothetical protein
MRKLKFYGLVLLAQYLARLACATQLGVGGETNFNKA